jgi:two-component system, LytTR family, response regulator
MIRTIIVDDEPLARRNLRGLLKQHPEFEVVAECPSGEDALSVLRSRAIDLMFLDIQMPEMNGFQVLEKLETEQMPVIIFATAFDEFAIQAFEVSATDYLLKPIEDKRFAQTIERVKSLVQRRSDGDVERRMLDLLEKKDRRSSENSRYSSRLLIRTHSRVLFVSVDEIDYIESEDYYSAVHVGAKTHLLRETMKELESRLDPRIFLRIHRSAIVHIGRIKELRQTDSGGHNVHLEDGTVLPLSRSRWDAVRSALYT